MQIKHLVLTLGFALYTGPGPGPVIVDNISPVIAIHRAGHPAPYYRNGYRFYPVDPHTNPHPLGHGYVIIDPKPGNETSLEHHNLESHYDTDTLFSAGYMWIREKMELKPPC
jgi:hypothetical protein